jgi:hypothetical protein
MTQPELKVVALSKIKSCLCILLGCTGSPRRCSQSSSLSVDLVQRHRPAAPTTTGWSCRRNFFFRDGAGVEGRWMEPGLVRRAAAAATEPRGRFRDRRGVAHSGWGPRWYYSLPLARARRGAARCRPTCRRRRPAKPRSARRLSKRFVCCCLERRSKWSGPRS